MSRIPAGVYKGVSRRIYKVKHLLTAYRKIPIGHILFRCVLAKKVYAVLLKQRIKLREKGDVPFGELLLGEFGGISVMKNRSVDSKNAADLNRTLDDVDDVLVIGVFTEGICPGGMGLNEGKSLFFGKLLELQNIVSPIVAKEYFGVFILGIEIQVYIFKACLGNTFDALEVGLTEEFEISRCGCKLHVLSPFVGLKYVVERLGLCKRNASLRPLIKMLYHKNMNSSSKKTHPNRQKRIIGNQHSKNPDGEAGICCVVHIIPLKGQAL